jgi:hypothetical protein
MEEFEMTLTGINGKMVMKIMVLGAMVAGLTLGSADQALARGGRGRGGNGGSMGSGSCTPGDVSATGSYGSFGGSQGTGKGNGTRQRLRDGSSGNCTATDATGIITDDSGVVTAQSSRSMGRGRGQGQAGGGQGAGQGQAGRAAGSGQGTTGQGTGGRWSSETPSNLDAAGQDAFNNFKTARDNYFSVRNNGGSDEEIKSAYDSFLQSRDSFRNSYRTVTPVASEVTE